MVSKDRSIWRQVLSVLQGHERFAGANGVICPMNHLFADWITVECFAQTEAKQCLGPSPFADPFLPLVLEFCGFSRAFIDVEFPPKRQNDGRTASPYRTSSAMIFELGSVRS